MEYYELNMKYEIFLVTVPDILHSLNWMKINVEMNWKILWL